MPYRLMMTVIGRVTRVMNTVNSAILGLISLDIPRAYLKTYLIPPASGTLYDPFGPRVADAPTNTIDAIETIPEKMMLGMAPVASRQKTSRE
jgi:hypothetical protein